MCTCGYVGIRYDCKSVCVYECVRVYTYVYECIRVRKCVYVLKHKCAVRQREHNHRTAIIWASMEAGPHVLVTQELDNETLDELARKKTTRRERGEA